MNRCKGKKKDQLEFIDSDMNKKLFNTKKMCFNSCREQFSVIVDRIELQIPESIDKKNHKFQHS